MEDQGVVVVKDSFLARITQAIKKFFFKGKTNELLLAEKNKSRIKLIEANEEFIQKEIQDARRAYRKYVINNDKNISIDVLSYITQKINENEQEIRKIIQINNDDITYEEIVQLIEDEKNNVESFKSKNKKTGRFNVPVGVIGMECSNVNDCIKCILKAISTRNAIIILHNNYSKYSTEALILLIIKECLKNYYIDDNIIQMFEKEEIDLKKLDKLIKKDGEKIEKEIPKTIYIYQENDNYETEVQNEIDRLKNNDIYKSYEIKPIKGEFGTIVNYLNNDKASAVCMYTDNSQKAYKFINWIDSPNVFVNTGVQKCKNSIAGENDFFKSKYVLHEDVF